MGMRGGGEASVEEDGVGFGGVKFAPGFVSDVKGGQDATVVECQGVPVVVDLVATDDLAIGGLGA
jgi:hypothetical protein